MYTLYQVQLTDINSKSCYTLEVATNDYDAFDKATEHLIKNNLDNGPFFLNAYCEIGTSREETLILQRITK